MSIDLAELSLRTVTGLDLTGGEGFFIEPNWTEPTDLLDAFTSPVEGKSTKVKPDTVVGPTIERSNGVRTKIGETRWSGQYRFMPYTHARQYNLFNAMRRWQGRVKPFWMPSWGSDFKIIRHVDPADSNAIYVEPNGFEYVYEDDRFGVMIETFDRNLDVHQCTGYDHLTGCLFVTGPLQQRIETSNIARVSLVRRVRSASNSFDWRYTTDAVAEVGLRVIEVLGEGAFL